VKPGLAILIDQSESMEIEDRGQGSGVSARGGSAFGGKGQEKRKDIAIKLAGEIKKKLKNKYEIVISDFGGDETAVGDALNSIEKENLAAIVVLSDGNNNAGLDPLSAARTLNPEGISVYTVGIGSPSSGADLAIEKVIAPEVGVIGEKTRVKIDLKGSRVKGLRQRRIRLRWKGSRLKVFETETLIFEKEIKFKDADFQEEQSLEFLPGQRGITAYRAEIEPLPGEDIIENNKYVFHINNIRKQKVLYLNGAPGLEYKFLNRTLQNNQEISLTSYLNQKDGKLLIDKVSGYDLIILGNISEGQISKSTIDALAKAVKEKNTSLILLGGKHAFGAGGWENASLYELLPVEIENNKDYQNGEFKIDPAVDGIYSPALKLSDKEAANLEIWNNFPPLTGINLLRAKEGAFVLLQTTQKDKTYPILAVSEQGKAKIIALAADDFWRFGFLPLAVDKSAEHYVKFWGNIIRLAGNAENLSEMDLPQKKTSLEMQRVSLNTPLLKNIAELGNGKFYFAKEALGIYQDLKGANQRIPVKYEIELLRKVPLFLLLIGLLGTEWFLRRKWRIE
jgi:uncharacterized membrane protein